MAKRKKQQEKKAQSGNGKDKTAESKTSESKTSESETAEAKAGGNGKDKKPDVEEDAYAAMPNEVSDPGSVFKMALLEAQRVALENKRAFLELNFNLQISNTQKKMHQALFDIDAEVKELARRHKEQKDYIEETYGIALKSYTYNDETGVLTKQDLTEE
jgi:hypothetical protein